MNALISFVFITVAGLINGSFALPTKYVKNWKFENIWLQYAIWAFLILPWVVAFFISPQVLSVYHNTEYLLWIMFVGGFLFGIGQICFALSFNFIGLGLGFVINIGLGTTLGFLLPLVIQHPDEILTPFGVMTLLGVILIVAGLLISNRAGILRDHKEQVEASKKNWYLVGVVLAAIAGIFSAGQNLAFALTFMMQHVALDMGATSFGASTIMWPGFLVCSFIPYAIYMLILQVKNKTFTCYKASGSLRYHVFALVMAVFWYGSLMFYSQASMVIGKLGPMVGWPLFMTLIILTSNFWGWKHGEWKHANQKAKNMMKLGLVFFVLAVVVLGYSSSFAH